MTRFSTWLTATLSRLHAISGWNPEREPKQVWITGEGDIADLLALAFSRLGNPDVILHRGPGPSETTPALKTWLDGITWHERFRS